MIHNDHELKVTRECIARFEDQLTHLRLRRDKPCQLPCWSIRFFAEIDRRQLAVREYLASHPTEMATAG